MADLHIERPHTLATPAAMDLAQHWVKQAQTDWGMQCHPCTDAPEGSQAWRFERTGVSGELRVDGQRFALDLKLGFLLSAYRERIRSQIETNLDTAIRDVSSGC
jgi:putative polyhydroxyalkanoate system protein